MLFTLKMNIKKITFSILCALFIAMFAGAAFAKPSMDEMDSLLDDIYLLEDSIQPERTLDILKIESIPDRSSAVPSLKNDKINMPLIIGGGVFGALFIAILYMYYLKVDRLSDKVETSKDLIEKYLYDIKENQNEFEKLEKKIEGNVVKMNEIKKYFQKQLSSNKQLLK